MSDALSWLLAFQGVTRVTSPPHWVWTTPGEERCTRSWVACCHLMGQPGFEVHVHPYPGTANPEGYAVRLGELGNPSKVLPSLELAMRWAEAYVSVVAGGGEPTP